MDDSITITYRSGYDTITVTWAGDDASFLAVGIDPSDELVLAAVEAEGLNFTHEGRDWVSEF